MLVVSAEAQSEPPNHKTLLAISYMQIQKELQAHEYFHFLLKLQQPNTDSTKIITLKMRTILLNWLEKITLQTFHFSVQTLFTATSIIDQYLAKTNQSPKTLQLIGCAALLIASKLKEEIIVDPECYVTASRAVFSKKELLEKEKTLYRYIDWRKVRRLALYDLRLGSQILNMKERVQKFQYFLWDCVKDEQISCWKQSKIVYSVISLMIVDPEHKIQTKSSLNLLKQL